MSEMIAVLCLQLAVLGDSSGLIKPLPPAQQGLLCSKCFNDSAG